MPKRTSTTANRQGFAHLRSDGSACMVDVSEKLPTERTAVAHARVLLKPAVLRQLRRSGGPKGDPLEVARLAGILAAKRTAELIPLCHPLPLTHADVEARYDRQGVEILARVKTTAPTGVEMEALVAAAVAALTVYDMCKALDRSITISDLYLVEKSGGRSGTYRRGLP